MHPARFLLLLLLVLASSATAQEAFPGLKAVLTPAEWQRAGLDRLTPDELGVIDAALIRHQARRDAARPAAATSPASAPSTAPAVPRGWLERFGLPVFGSDDWRTLPPLRARVVAWESANRFRLDNGQVWEGFEPVRFELVGRDIEIQARPHGQYALVLEGQSTTIRVLRLR